MERASGVPIACEGSRSQRLRVSAVLRGRHPDQYVGSGSGPNTWLQVQPAQSTSCGAPQLQRRLHLGVGRVVDHG